MNIDEKNRIIENYIKNISNQINEKYNGLIDDNKISRAILMFKNSNDDLETIIIPKINDLAQQVIDNYLRLKEEEQRNMMITNIDKNINSDFFIEMLRKNWNYTHSIGHLGNLIGESYIHHIINKDGYGFEYYMNHIENLYSQYGERKISQEQFELEKAKLISSVIASKLGINKQNISQKDMERIKNYFLQEFVVNGYVSHSFPDAYYESIMTNGLISSINLRQDKPLEVQEIQDIFMDKGVVAPMGGYPYYGGSGIYYEYDFTKMFRHAIDSPEWFNWFTSSDHITNYHDSVEVSPYILRSEPDCRNNVDDLCLNAGLNEFETQKVVDFYKKYYSKFSSPKLNVALIPKRVIGKDIIFNVLPNDMNLFSTISYVLNDGSRQYTEHNGNVYEGTIFSNQFGISVIPNASSFISAKKYDRESQEHLIKPENNLAVLQAVDENRNRLVPSMVSKVEHAKKNVHSKIKSTNIDEINFNARSQNEIQTYKMIQRKNTEIKKQKRMKNNPKVLVRKLPSTSSQVNSLNGNKGYVNVITLSLIVSFVLGVLFTSVYILFKR